MILGPLLFLKLLIKWFSESAEAVGLIKGKWQPLLYRKAQKIKVRRECENLFIFEAKVTYVKWTMGYYPKNQWDPPNCLVTMNQKPL